MQQITKTAYYDLEALWLATLNPDTNLLNKVEECRTCLPRRSVEHLRANYLYQVVSAKIQFGNIVKEFVTLGDEIATDQSRANSLVNRIQTIQNQWALALVNSPFFTQLRALIDLSKCAHQIMKDLIEHRVELKSREQHPFTFQGKLQTYIQKNSEVEQALSNFPEPVETLLTTQHVLLATLISNDRIKIVAVAAGITLAFLQGTAEATIAKVFDQASSLIHIAAENPHSLEAQEFNQALGQFGITINLVTTEDGQRKIEFRKEGRLFSFNL